MTCSTDADSDLWEVAVWEDALAVDDREIYLTCQVHDEAVAIPETVDCIRALTGLDRDAGRSIEDTGRALGIAKSFLPATTQPIPHPAGPNVRHPALERVVARHAELRDIGPEGAEEPEE